MRCPILWLSILFGLLNLLLQWLMNKKGELTEREKKKLGHFMYMSSWINAQAAAMGCAPAQDPDVVRANEAMEQDL